MNGKMISGKPLYVAFAQRKEDRKAMLQVTVLKPVEFV
jgi:polyadenylate-binding protein